jgi:uncharacterized protein (DUF2384 family)
LRTLGVSAHAPSYHVRNIYNVAERNVKYFQPRTAMDWLVGNEPFLDHARPIDVLVTRGPGPLLVVQYRVRSMR